MRQPQGPTKQEIANDSMRFDSNSNNKSTGDAKSRVSSPISNSPSTIPQSSSIPPTNSSSSTPMSAIAPKRKRPRPVKYEEENPSVYPVRNSPISTTKVEIDQPPKIETSSSNLDKNSGSTAENGVLSHEMVASQTAPASTEPPQQQELLKSESNPLHDSLHDSKTSVQESDSRDLAVNKEEHRSPKKESPPDGHRLDEDRESVTATKVNTTVLEIETQREEKFQIDLMAPPPVGSSPERDSEVGFVAVDPKPIVANVEMEIKPVVKEDDKAVKIRKDVNVESEDKKAKVAAEEVESQKPVVIVNKERNIDLQLDLEKSDRDSVDVTGIGNKAHQNIQKQQTLGTEKAAQSSSLPLPMSMASWPGGLPHMGRYMAPLQGVVSMDGSTVPSAAVQPPHLLFGQPRPKRCATHYYIARTIHCQQQLARNPFWPAVAGSALQFGAKACNVNVVPSADLHSGRAVNSAQDKGQGLAIFPGHSGKEKSSQNSNIVDSAQRKQILLQQPLPPGAPSNILHAPAFIFPLNQQQAAAAAAASVRPGTLKSAPVAAGNTASPSASNSASISATATAVAGATAVSFNYPNMPGSEPQYLAILQNSAYPIPIPAHVSTPTYRGTPPQAMPFFNGPFYSSQMIHPTQLQTPHSQQGQLGHQHPSISSGSSSSQKHVHNQQQRPHGSSVNGGSGNLQVFPTSKNQTSQSLQLQQRQQIQNHHMPHQTRQLESELGSEDSPSTADSRASRANMSIYGQNFAMPIHPPNFTLMTPPTMGGSTSGSGNAGEKKQQQSQPQGSKVGVEHSQAFAMSFASINGATNAPSLDISSIAQNHAILQSFPEAARHGYPFMAAAAVAQATQQKKNYRVSEEGKTSGNDGSNVEEERKVMPGGKAQATAGQSIAFSLPDLTDTSVSTLPGNTVIDSSARTLNLGSTPARSISTVMSASISTVNASNVPQQLQRNQQQQQMIQLQKQHQFAAAAAASARSKTQATSNGSVFSDHISSSSSMAVKFPNALSGFPPNLVQSNSSPVQSPQWKNSVRTTTSQGPSPSLASTSSSLKNLPQQQGRIQQGQTQISFASNPKSSSAPQGQQVPNSNQSQSPPMVVGSPTTSISKSAGGSPRTTSTSTGNKGGQSSTLSSQQPKNSSSMPAQKSSPVGGRNIPSILGHPHNSTPTNSSGTKSQLPQQQQQQLPKHALQQAQMLYNNSFMQAQVQHAASSAHTTSAPSGFYLQRHRSEQQQQPQGLSVTSSAGMLLCPVSLPNTATTDPAKAVAANSMKGGGLPSQGLIHAQFAAAQTSGKPHLVPAGLSYVHAVPTAVQVKPAEHKQPAAE
ncbi:protein TIME FOR COFFEE isoform X6 [Jatropha curcas]|nr:protein TIME FOR COFFEE isoform X6 [Jatropha curcas]